MFIQSFITNFRGGTRKNRFRVRCNIPGFTIPTIIGQPSDFKPEAIASAGPGDISGQGGFDDFHVLAAALPTSIITTNPIDYQGRRILYPGDRIYSGDGFNVWTMRVLDDLDNPASSATHKNLWKGLHAWSDSINDHVTNTGNVLEFGTIVVEQLNLNAKEPSPFGGGVTDGGILKSATLIECWPQSISTIDFEMQARDQYNYFDVTFCFKYVQYSGG